MTEDTQLPDASHVAALEIAFQQRKEIDRLQTAMRAALGAIGDQDYDGAAVILRSALEEKR